MSRTDAIRASLFRLPLHLGPASFYNKTSLGATASPSRTSHGPCSELPCDWCDLTHANPREANGALGPF